MLGMEPSYTQSCNGGAGPYHVAKAPSEYSIYNDNEIMCAMLECVLAKTQGIIIDCNITPREDSLHD
jgi:hypothetical protein